MPEKRTSGKIENAVILGAGNVAWHLGHLLYATGTRILQVYNRSAVSGEALATGIKATFTQSLAGINRKADIYIIAVTDDAIEGVVQSGCFNDTTGMVVHTAGSVGIDVLKAGTERCGVLYPLQTLTRGRIVKGSDIPFLIEANTAEDINLLRALAEKLSDKVREADSSQRLFAHLAGVLASNFSNHMYALSHKILGDNNLAFDCLTPLIRETVEKAISLSPAIAQTGPAVRGSNAVIQKHLALLEKYPEIREIYRIISGSIQSYHRGKGDVPK